MTADPTGLARASLRVNFSWMLVGNLLYAGAQFGTAMVLAKLGSPETVGTFGLALAFTAPVFAFTNLNLRAVQATDTDGEHAFADYFGQRLLATGLAAVVIAAIAAGLAATGATAETLLVIGVVGAAKAVEAISDIFYGMYQRHERMDGIARSLMLRGPPNLIVIGVVLWATQSLVWAMVGQLVLWSVVLVLHDVPRGRVVLAGRPLTPRFEAPSLRAITWTALPLGFVILLFSLTHNVPRYVIEAFHGRADVGVFVALAWLVQAGQTVIRSLGQAAVPRLAAHYAAGRRRRFVQLALALQGFGLLVGVAGVAVAALVGPTLLTVVYEQGYAAYNPVFVVIMVAGGLTYLTWFFTNIITAARYFRPQAPIALSVAVVTLAGCLWWVPEHGILGAAWAWIAAQVVQLAWGIGLTVVAVRAPVSDQPTRPAT